MTKVAPERGDQWNESDRVLRRNPGKENDLRIQRMRWQAATSLLNCQAELYGIKSQRSYGWGQLTSLSPYNLACFSWFVDTDSCVEEVNKQNQLSKRNQIYDKGKISWVRLQLS